MKKKMLFIFNPKAGKGKIKTSLLDIVDVFNKGGYEVMIRATQHPRDAYEQARDYAEEMDLIVCSGGDGTLDEVVTGVMEKKLGSHWLHSGGKHQRFCKQPVYAQKYGGSGVHDHGRTALSL